MDAARESVLWRATLPDRGQVAVSDPPALEPALGPGGVTRRILRSWAGTPRYGTRALSRPESP
jgi:hypothetical protein